MASRCGLSFKYRYIDKIKGGPRGTPAKVGVTVHLAQELVFQGARVQDALAQAIAEVDEVLTHKEEEKCRTFALSLATFKEKVDKFSERYPVKELFLEKKWAIKPDFTPCDFFDNDGMIRGIVDMGILLENGFLVIIDHKSGRMHPMSHFGKQLDVYSIMSQAHYPDVKGVQCALNFMAHDKVAWGKPKSTKFILDVLRPWLVKYLNDRATGLEKFPAKMGFHCKWCDYRDLCPEIADNGNGESNK
jgi:hypothetical protein